MRCRYCGRNQEEAKHFGSTQCNPPFTTRPHVFDGQHPADIRKADEGLAERSPEHQARKLLDDRFGRGKEFAHRKIAEDVMVSRIYECAIMVIADLLR